ncbi:MAG: hypothetical protein K6E29_00965 [Cyanobacteria bacterium RUI128]|nr:hypothetical protein [Cyanobacteria bacterium RUI128]
MNNFENENGSNTKQNLSKSGITKPDIELQDFFEYLDSKVVDKIKNTPKEDIERIGHDVNQYEYELNGISNILKSLK